jgi:DnaJ like chaperone protein
MMRLWIFLLLILYLLSPFDLVPDFLFGPGWLDDLSLVGIFAYYYLYWKRKDTATGEGSRDEGKQERPAQRSPHEVLGLDRSAGAEEIKAAYRRLANQYHPDKVTHLGEEFRVLAEQKFKEIQRAYQELSTGQS